ncbi:conserved hypothetical protein [Candidatus Sulfotelmatobacter kueseliae]|uniref:Uncharacterized protein n=1 Tax=Candidatus Sulfotelmatobacter kueseliae TaxID=2042962 RepID=A0A2U3KKL5_9BACT|nr:conserved hypothetical protein [Candidatus Sulfotelmatobacter kueseliae]
MASIEKRIISALLAKMRKRRGARMAPHGKLSVDSTAVVPPARLREALFSDFAAVAELKRRWGLGADSLENWERLWCRNPALVGSGVKRPIGWVLEANGAIVAYLGNISLQCRYGDRTLTAVTATAFVAEPPYRALAVTLAAAFYRQKSVDLFITSSAIEASGKIALAFKCAALPESDYDTVRFWVLRSYPFAQVLMNELRVSRLLLPIGSILAALAIRADTIIRRRWPRRSAIRLAVSEISLDDVGDDFQTLWTEKIKEKTRLYADRSAATLRWHFDIPGDRGRVRVLCCHKDGKLDGYAVVRSEVDPRAGLRTSTVADMIVRQDDPAVVHALLVAAYEHAKNEGSEIFQIQGFTCDVREVFSDWAPYQRKFPAHPYFYKATDPVLHRVLGDPKAWYACPFDGDASLVRPSYSSCDSHATFQRETESTQTVVAVVSESERTHVS